MDHSARELIMQFHAYRRGTVSRMGNRAASVDISAFHDRGRQIATGKAVYSVKRGPGANLR